MGILTFPRQIVLAVFLFLSSPQHAAGFLAGGPPAARSAAITPAISSRTTRQTMSSSVMSRKLSDNRDDFVLQSNSDQAVVGAVGTAAGLVVLYSEFTLKTTGCGLPAGPAGLIGATEGLSYLAVTGIAVYSVYKKVRTQSGLPAGPFGLLGAAEGLSFLAIAAGFVVLAFQLADYGYIPNAVPMEGGMCQ